MAVAEDDATNITNMQHGKIIKHTSVHTFKQIVLQQKAFYIIDPFRCHGTEPGKTSKFIFTTSTHTRSPHIHTGVKSADVDAIIRN